MTDIEILNRRLSEELGSIGGRPQFSWAWTPDLMYITVTPGGTYQRRTWADRIGPCWVLSHFRPPVSYDVTSNTEKPITREAWWRSFQGQFPYPDRGMLYPYPETALRQGLKPDSEDTAFYIISIKTQRSKSYEDHLREGAEERQAMDDENKKQFYAEAEDWFPAFWNNGTAHEPGKRGAHVSFGGV